MLAIMGHMNWAMLNRYSHIGKAAKVAAMAVIGSGAFFEAVPNESREVVTRERSRPVLISYKGG
jgi:hypothetical protein